LSATINTKHKSRENHDLVAKTTEVTLSGFKFRILEDKVTKEKYIEIEGEVYTFA
jgi:hypothetical protein